MSIRSIERALSVLDCFEPDRPSQSLSEICSRLKLPKTTVFRILQALVDYGYVINTADLKFELSLKVLRLADSVRIDSDMVRLARPYLEEIAEATGETVALSWINGDDRIIVDTVECKHQLQLVLKRGERNPRYTAATGIVFLAYDPEALEAYLKTHPENAETMHSAVAEVLEKGYAATTDFRVKGSAGIAAPLFDMKDRCIYSIGVYGPASRIVSNRDAIIAHLLPGALKVSQLAGSRLVNRLPPFAALKP
ncbi:IclR family transcriptional regulator [Pseudorhizobium flavum]|uniref:DNA-binding IclR family transcriptional regulator n=1 Tax=Pseudorhizobium flavum TaxID=1335061 RepID=A0A7W9Z1N1_9HYPH|nr:IclR family transcriptional regulator [Pseudorhizobium flavum]MBB6181934.1 DNA-binding IclR family transcriptional regulator [Pseudorhizobium flavum]CAD6628750.1 IclR family transcriptional regulator [Pseudorhizobium flavum]